MIGKIIFFVFTAVVLGVILFMFYQNIYLPNNPSTFKKADFIFNESETNAYLNEGQFYSNMRFNHLPVTYFIDKSSCNEKRQSDAKRAAEIISEKTKVSFLEMNAKINADVIIRCDDANIEKESGLFIAGEGGPTSVRPTGLFHVIEKGSVLLFKDSNCENPQVAIHELIHVLGFDHVNDTESLMYPITDCSQKLTPEIINKINELYSVEPLPDLYIKSVNATKKTVYLDFNIEIRNKGLKKSENTHKLK